jgi:hypothetical protein
MSVIDGFGHDLFVSYAHADNFEADGQRDISRLVNSLRPMVRQRLGRGGADLSIYFDSQLRANDQLADLIAAAQSSAMLLVVASPSWLASEFCQQELAAFAATRSDPRDIFVAEYLPPLDAQRYPAPIDQHHRFAFHRPLDEGSTIHVPIPASDDARLFRVHALAAQIASRLRDLRDGRASPAAPVAPAASGEAIEVRRPITSAAAESARPAGKRALLAEPTDDLEASAAKVRAHLEQYGIEVVSAPPSYEGLGDFQSGFRQLANEATMLVQLVGPHAGRRPSSMPGGIAQWQFDMAKDAGLPAMQWRNPEIQVDTLEDEAQRALLEGADVVCSTLSEFKERLVAALQPDPEPEDTAQKRTLSLAGSKIFFVDAEERDRDAVDLVFNSLEDTGHLILESEPESADASARLKDLEKQFASCDGLILLHGAAPSTWLKSQLVLFTKLNAMRKDKLELMAICKGPPVPKDDIRFRLANAQIVDCGENWDMSRLRTLIENVAA